MTPTRRAIAFWILRVGIAVILVILLQAWRGPDPMLWWLAAGYAAISLFTTYMVIRSRRGGDGS
ncbi:hypothetical protein JQC91_02255 [Jannaschia sp. Os4]|uniref:hypothetical protein n=1 Tax=Jannaschia sp. Os4 TaxID=2807617 RepID=UPI00193A1893|nr:hypothetical protein [Jannaschia sp. Os4]MBM2575116.1 hypothetical protein [Jannaschia sp. Os4]